MTFKEIFDKWLDDTVKSGAAHGRFFTPLCEKVDAKMAFDFGSSITNDVLCQNVFCDYCLEYLVSNNEPFYQSFLKYNS